VKEWTRLEPLSKPTSVQYKVVAQVGIAKVATKATKATDISPGHDLPTTFGIRHVIFPSITLWLFNIAMGNGS
jgi:hypothetical protein